MNKKEKQIPTELIKSALIATAILVGVSLFLEKVIFKDRIRRITSILKDEENLIESINSNNNRIISYFLTLNDYDPNYKDKKHHKSLLQWAKELILRGADLNYQEPDTGRTAFHHLVALENFELLKLALSKGANSTIKDKSNVTPLDLSLKLKNKDFFYLIKKD